MLLALFLMLLAAAVAALAAVVAAKTMVIRNLRLPGVKERPVALQMRRRLCHGMSGLRCRETLALHRAPRKFMRPGVRGCLSCVLVLAGPPSFAGQLARGLLYRWWRRAQGQQRRCVLHTREQEEEKGGLAVACPCARCPLLPFPESSTVCLLHRA